MKLFLYFSTKKLDKFEFSNALWLEKEAAHSTIQWLPGAHSDSQEPQEPAGQHNLDTQVT